MAADRKKSWFSDHWLLFGTFGWKHVTPYMATDQKKSQHLLVAGEFWQKHVLLLIFTKVYTGCFVYLFTPKHMVLID